MRVVVVGASGNVGTSTVEALKGDKRVDEVIGVARRLPAPGTLDIKWHAADVATDDLGPLLQGVDAVVHLAWALTPSWRPVALQATNIVGSRRLFDAVGRSGVKALVYASSVGAYSAAPKTSPVDESYPTDGVPTSLYSRQKAYVERLLDRFELEHESVRVVRLRPSLIFKAEAAREIRHLFLGHLVPSRLLGRPPVVPAIPGLAIQGVHTSDVADAYRRAVTGSVTGAFNIAAEPVLTPAVLAETLGARRIPMPVTVVRAAAAATYRLRAQPTEPGWIDLALRSPLLDTTRARRELGWQPTVSGTDALLELLDAMGRDQHGPTPQLVAAAGGV